MFSLLLEKENNIYKTEVNWYTEKYKFMSYTFYCKINCEIFFITEDFLSF